MTEEEEEQANETKRGAQGDINIINIFKII